MRFIGSVTPGLARNRQSTGSHETGPQCSSESQLPDKSATQVEEVINDPDAIQFQHFGKNNGQILIHRRSSSPEYRTASQGTIKEQKIAQHVFADRS